MELSTSSDGGNTWSAPVQIASVRLTPDTYNGFNGCVPNTRERVSNIPALGIDNSSGTHAGHLPAVMYSWTGSYMRVQVATSTNRGVTWSTSVPVAPSTDTHDQFFPWLSVSRSGIVG